MDDSYEPTLHVLLQALWEQYKTLGLSAAQLEDLGTMIAAEVGNVWQCSPRSVSQCFHVNEADIPINCNFAWWRPIVLISYLGLAFYAPSTHQRTVCLSQLQMLIQVFM